MGTLFLGSPFCYPPGRDTAPAHGRTHRLQRLGSVPLSLLPGVSHTGWRRCCLGAGCPWGPGAQQEKTGAWRGVGSRGGGGGGGGQVLIAALSPSPPVSWATAPKSTPGGSSPWLAAPLSQSSVLRLLLCRPPQQTWAPLCPSPLLSILSLARFSPPARPLWGASPP